MKPVLFTAAAVIVMHANQNWIVVKILYLSYDEDVNHLTAFLFLSDTDKCLTA